ncbi:MAG: hypothetical protein AAGK67_05985 [Pseudomonadota bacterium]
MSKLSKRASVNFAIWRPLKIAFAIDLWTLEEAMDGKARVPRKVMGWVIKRENWRRAEYDRNYPSKIARVLGQEPDNAEDDLKLLGIATRDWEYNPSDTETVRWQLAPWVVNAAQGDNT